MPAFHSASVSVTDIVYDHMLIEVNNNLLFKDFEYKICTEDLKLLRQGVFRGPAVQLRLSFMSTGIYQLQLSNDGKEWQYYAFEKKEANIIYA